MRAWVRACTIAAVSLATAGCGSEQVVRTVTVPDREAVKRVGGFAFAEMKRHSRKTCAIVPREALVASFRRVSGDRPSYLGRHLTANDIGLMYAEDVKISPVALQRAAYDGCVEGLERSRPVRQVPRRAGSDP